MKAPVLCVLAATALLVACESTPYRDSNARTHEIGCIAGTVGGALVGGLVGSTIGGGRGRTLATAAGIGAGGLAGHQLGC
jgi:outer membrane lipoprotein SlyB